MAKTPNLETRIDKAAEEILLVAARNGIVIAEPCGSGSITGDDANELWQRAVQLARLRCRIASTGDNDQVIQSPGNFTQ